MNKKGKHIKMNQEADKAYFDSLTDRIMDRVELEKSVLFADPKLKELPFLTPDGYFEQLGESIVKQASSVKVIPLYNRSWFRYAATLVIILTTAFALLNPFEKDPFEKYLSDVSTEVLIEYTSSEETALDELFVDEEVMNVVINDMMADIAFTYEDLIDFETNEFYPDNY